MWVTKMYIIINTTGKNIYTSITQKQKIKKENRQRQFCNEEENGTTPDCTYVEVTFMLEPPFCRLFYSSLLYMRFTVPSALM